MKNSLSPASLVARSAAIMAALALLAILGALFVPDRVQAQPDVLVSNLGQTKTGQLILRNGDRSGQTFSIATTGEASYYTLSSIEILFSTNGIASTDMGLLTVSLWSIHASGTNAGHPKDQLYTLTNPASVAADAAATFAAPADLTLAAGRTYAVVVVYSKNIDTADIADAPFWEYAGTGDDADPAPGWSIVDSSHQRPAGGTSWSETANRAQKIRVNGTAVQPDVLVSNLGQTKTGQLILRNGDRSGQTFSIATTSEASYYTLSSIEILFSTNGIASTDMGLLTVSLWSIHASGTNAGQPDSLLYTLTNPASVAADAAATFVAPADLALAAGRTYAVVVVYSKNIDTADIADAPFWEYAGTGDDADPAPGWSIVDSSHQRPAGEASWEETANRAQKISVNGNETINNDPVFASTAETREVAENSAAGTNVGAVIPEATDADDDTLTYSMEGDDEASFDFDASTRQITTKTGVTYNYEATENTYSVTVTADDGNDGNATVAVTINLTDVAEKSAKPAKPTLAAVTGSSTSLNATWTKPGLNGGPEITGYNVQYKLSTASTWSDFAHSGTGVMATITGLTASMSYQVRVQAKNGETDSDWSDASDVLSTTSTPNAEAQDATITSLLSRLDVELRETEQHTASYDSHGAGYNTSINKVHGTLSPAGFNYPAGFGPWYTVEALVSSQEGPSGKAVSTGLNLVVRGQVTSVASSGTHRAHVLPSGASITLHLEGDDFSKSYSLESAELAARRTVTKCTPEGGIERHCMVGETANEDYGWDSNLPPRLTDGDSILVRLRYKAPRPGKPGTPTVTVPTGKSGALIVNWAAPSSNNPAVLGYHVYVIRGSQLRLKSVDASTTRLPVLLLEPDTAYDVRVRARTALALGPWSGTARARTNPLQGTNSPQVTLDLNGVTKVKERDGLPMRLKVTGMPNLHAGAFPKRFEGEKQLSGVEFLLLDRIAKVYTYEDHPGGCGGGSFRSGALTIGDDGEVYHDSGYLVIPAGMSAYGPLYVELDTRCGNTSSSDNVRIDTTELCVEIADSSNNVPAGRTCPSGGMPGHAVDRLTARFVGVPRSHDGESEFTLRVAFIEDVGISPTSLREDALTVTRGTVTQAQRVDDRSDLFEITAEPDSDEDVTITLAAGSDCAAAGAICTEGEDPKKLYNSPAATVSGPTLTASFQGLPSQHDGETAFSFRIAFSEEIATGEEEFRDHSVEVWGGRVTRAEPVDQRRDLWEVEIEPALDDLVMISLRPSLSCDETGAVCTAGGRRLSVSPATMVAGPSTWPVQVNGEAQVGKTLTADPSNISDRFGVQVTSMTYQWLANNARMPGASGSTYTPGEGKQGKKISVMATFTDDRGNEDTVTSGPTDPVAARERNSRATGLPLISGRALVGQTLTADTSLIFDADGLENSVFSYLWEADDDSIPGATDPTYTPVQADVGKVITVIVSFLDDAGYSQSMTSPATMAVTTAEAAAAVKFAISLRYAANADGSVSLYWNAPDDEATGYRIDRRRYSLGEPKGLVYVEDTGSTATAYTDTEVTAGAPHSYRVQAIRGAELGEKTKFFKTKVFPLRKAVNSPAAGAPAISGVAQVGETLTADTSGIVDADGLEHVTQNYLWGINKGLIIGAVYGYQWLADEAEIEDATGSAYILADADEGKAIRVRVSFTDDGGHRETLTSSATAAVTQPNAPATGLPTVSGKARVGETLTVDTSGISDENGLDYATFTHRWITDDSVVVGAGTRAYTPTGGDQGKAVKVRVSFSDDAGNWETRTSAQTAAVEARANSAGICDRTAQVRETILDQLPDTSDCAAVTDTDLSGIIRLALSEMGITTLKSGDFSGLSNLRHLNLVDNELSALSDGIFDDLTGLQELSLFDNRISRLPDDIFDDLSELHSLHLNGNELSELPGGIFDNLTQLQSLSLSGNGLSELPDDIFDDLTELQSLSLGDNSLSELPDGAFDNLTELQWLDLGNNDLSELPGGIFDNLTRLRTLKLSHNDLSELPDGIFDNLTELEILYLHWNGLSELPDGILDKVTALSSLELSYNELSELPDGLFDDLSELQFLHLSDNELSVLPDRAFDSLTKLWSLSVGGNELSALPEDVFVNLAKLQSLDLNSNELSELPDGIFDDLSELHSLHLNGNELSELPDGIFDNLTKLRTLSVDYNELSELPDSVFDNLSELWGLSLVGNELSELPDGIFDNLANLKQLYLFSNKLSELPDRIFYGLAILDVLNIDENTGSPFTFTVELERPDENTVGLKVAQATPFDMEVTLSAEGGSLSSATVTIPAGNVSSEQITVSPDGAEPVAISVVSAAFLLGEFQQARGIQTGLGEHLTLGEDWDTDTPATGAPTISGAAQVGETLTADTSGITDADGLSNATFIYQWLGSRDTEIQGATNATYTLVAEDEGKAIKVRVTFTDDGGNRETLTSAPTAVVAAPPPPPPDNVRAVTQKSGAVELTWEAPDGATVTGYGIERRRAGEDRSNQQRSVGSPKDNHTLVEDTGSAETGYTDKSAEKGVEYEYQVSARNEAGAGEGSDWVRAGPEPVWGDGPPGAPGNLTVAAGDRELTLSWEPPEDNGNPPATRYRIEWRIDGKDYKKGHWGTSGSTTYTKTDLANGVKYVFRVKAENGSGNSYGPYGPASEEVSATPTSGSAVDLGTPVLSNTKTLHHGMVKLDWEDIEDAGWYVVQYYHVKGGEWLDLPTAGVDIAFHGSSAVVSNLHGLSWLRVRAMSCAGESEWSQIEELYGTKASDWEDVPVPEVEEGDQIDPCPVILGTPVLSNTKTLHHGMVKLDWEDIEDAGWHVVQYYHVKSGEWLGLPAAGVDIAFHGSSAVVSNLHGLSWLRVRAMSCAGESEWSQIEELYGTEALDWEGVPVPEVAEGDEIEPCSEDADTPDNSPATGAPTISGTVQVGETLTADTSGIADADGLANATFSYQWITDDSVIVASAARTYTPTDGDRGKSVKVRVSFTDDAGNPETRTSANTATVEARGNSPATGLPTISGTAQVGQTLTANTSGVTDADRLSSVQYEYQWLANDSDISGATNATYTLVADDEGKAIKVRVNFTDDAGNNEETLTSAGTEAVAAAPTPNGPATGAPAISGTAQVGETLTANTSGVADVDGLSNVQYEYQWLANDSDISGATNATYTLVAADEGQVIKVRASFTDDAGNNETLTSAPTAAVAAPAQADSEDEPAISYITVVVAEDTSDPDNTRTDFKITWSDVDDCSTEYNAYLNSWTYANGRDRTHLGSAATDGSQITSSLSNVEGEGAIFDVELYCGTEDSGRLVSSVSIPHDDGRLVSSTYTSEPPLTALTVSPGTLTPTFHSHTLNYTVPDVVSADDRLTLVATAKPDYRIVFVKHDAWGVATTCDLFSFSCGEWHYQDGDGNPVYPLTDADADAPGFQVDLAAGEKLAMHVLHDYRGRTLQMQFYGLTVTRASNSPATGLPTIDGTAQVGETLTASTSDIEDADGLTGATFSYQWLSSRDTDIQGATDAAYILVPGDAGKTIKVRVSFTDDEGNAEMLTSAATDAVSPAPTPNNPATGAPTISGTAQVGETLAAETSGINDDDGLDNVAYTYQWLSSRDTEIQGATDRTYTLAATDEGKAIKVRVSFTDDANNQETLTSAATEAVAAAPTPNSPATGAPTISGTAQVRETLTAGTSNIADDDGLANVSFSYQWLADDTEVQGATNADYTLADADEGQTIKVRVSFTDGAGNQEMLTSAPTAAVAAPAQADSEDEPSELSYLTVVVTEDDSDPDNVFTTFTITWNDAEDCSASYNAYLDGVVGDPIHLGSAASEGEQIAASLTNVSAESIGFDAKLYCGTIGSGRLVDSLWISEYSRSFDTVPISRAYLPKPGTYSTEPGLTALTVSSGTLTPAFHSQTLNYTVPDVANADGRITLTTTTKADYYTVAFIPGSLYFYSFVCSYGGQQSGLGYQDDTGNPLYPLTDADANTPGFQMELDEGENVFKIRVWPNCENGHVYKLTVTRAANAPANTPATGAPTISGAAQVGETLTAATSGIADADGLSGATFSYQWLSSRDTDIQGATDAAYILVPGDAGKTIKVRVSFTDDEGNAEMLTSAATDAVSAEPTPNNPATGAPTISGTAQVGETLTADTSGIADADGLSNVQYEYQWLADAAEIAGAIGSTYTLADTDEGKVIKVRVSFADDAGNEETLTSVATDAVAAAEPSEPPDKPRGLEATATHDSVTLTWDDPQDESITGYVILRRVRVSDQGGDFSELVADTESAATTYTDDSVKADTTYTYRIKAINGYGVSERSRWFHIDTPAAPVPDKPTGLSATASHDAITLTWDDPGDDSITGYVILRRLRHDDPKGHFDELVADTGTAAMTYTDDTVAASTTYTYRIKAINEHGVSERSRWFHIDTPAPP